MIYDTYFRRLMAAAAEGDTYLLDEINLQAAADPALSTHAFQQLHDAYFGLYCVCIGVTYLH